MMETTFDWKGAAMARTVSIGTQSFERLRASGGFYVDKTSFIRDWWLADDAVTLVCRPRRFGKTLNLDTVRCFLSTEFAGRGEELFGGLDVWEGGTEDERVRMRALQGTVPVVTLSFARVKQSDFASMLRRVNKIMVRALERHAYLRDWAGASESERASLAAITDNMDAETCADVPNLLCDLLLRYHGVAPVVLLDEYDAPMERAWLGGFWDEAADFMRDLMNSTFKTNPEMGRGLITGVTRVSRESIFSDLNNLCVVTTSTPLYQERFGFTQDEVDASLEEYGLNHLSDEVRRLYDGFTFGGVGSIYNPWSVTQLLKFGELQAWWANTSSNSLISEVVRRGDEELKKDFEELMRGDTIERVIDEQVVFSELDSTPEAVWALLLAAGYLTSPGKVPRNVAETPRPLKLTNHEVELTFDRMAKGWFSAARVRYDQFTRALLEGDTRVATRCLAEVARVCVSSFDSGTHPSEDSEPERFYHGLVLGLLAQLRGRWSVESRRESGYGRYDVAIVPTDGALGADPAVVIEFKVFDPDEEDSLADTVGRARAQIEERDYVAGIKARGIDESRIRIFGIAFRGKEVLVG